MASGRIEAQERAERLASECGISLDEAMSHVSHDMECESAAMAALRQRPTRKR